MELELLKAEAKIIAERVPLKFQELRAVIDKLAALRFGMTPEQSEELNQWIRDLKQSVLDDKGTP